MICPKCGRPVAESAVICPGCDFILDTGFLGEEILDEEKALRPGQGGVDPAVFNLIDAVILGDIEETAQTFDTSDSGFHVKESTGARLYVSGRSQALLAPDAVPERVGKEDVALTPFERHVLELIDGRTPVEHIRDAAGLDEVEVRTALATLADKGVIQVSKRMLVPLEGERSPPRRRVEGARIPDAFAGAMSGYVDETDRAIDDAFRTRTNLAPMPESDSTGVASEFVDSVFAEATPPVEELPPLGQSELASLAGSETPEASPPIGTSAAASGAGSFADFSDVQADNESPDARTVRLGPDNGGPRATPGSAVPPPAAETTPVLAAPRPSEPDEFSGDEYSDLDAFAASSSSSPSLPARLAEAAKSTGEITPAPATPASSSFASFDDEPGLFGAPTVQVIRGQPARTAPPPGAARPTASISSDDDIEDLDEAMLLKPSPPREDPPAEERSGPSLVSEIAGAPNHDEAALAFADDAFSEVTHGLKEHARSADHGGRRGSGPSKGTAGSSSPAESQSLTPLGTGVDQAAPRRRPMVDTASSSGPVANAADRAAAQVETTALRRRATQIFAEALRDYQNGDLGRAKMNAKLASVYDPQNPEYNAALEAWSREDGDRSALEQRRENVLYDEAQRCENEGDFDAAIALLREGILANPSIAAFHNRLGVVLALRKRDYVAAANMVRRAVDLEPSNLHYRHNLGKILAKANVAPVVEGSVRRDAPARPE